MSKVLLIKPRFLGEDLQAITHPLGAMYIGALLKRNGHEPKIHDCALDYKNLRLLKREITEWKPDFIGISIIVTELKQTGKIMKIIREIRPDVPVIFGGPWPSSNYEEAIKNIGADFVVMGEGEHVFPELINAINNNLQTRSIPGTVCMIDGHINVNPGQQLTEKQLNELPFPAWELINNKLYAKTSSFATMGCRPYMSIITSRGCPYRCAYCHQTMGKVFRKRAVESVLAEMEELYFKYGVKEFEIIDDCFNLDRERMLGILLGIRNRFGKVNLHFPNGVRADIFKPGDMHIFKQAGTVSIVFAIETSSPRLQKMIQKNLNIEKAVLTVNEAVKAGIFSTGCFMIGFPTETYEEAYATVEFASRLPIHRAYIFNPTPFDGTKLAEMVSESQKKRNYDINPHDANYFNSIFNISAMSDNELRKIYRLAYRRIYLNPRRMLRLVVHHPNVFSIPKSALLTLIKILPRR